MIPEGLSSQRQDDSVPKQKGIRRYATFPNFPLSKSISSSSIKSDFSIHIKKVNPSPSEQFSRSDPSKRFSTSETVPK